MNQSNAINLYQPITSVLDQRDVAIVDQIMNDQVGR